MIKCRLNVDILKVSGKKLTLVHGDYRVHGVYGFYGFYDVYRGL